MVSIEARLKALAVLRRQTEEELDQLVREALAKGIDEWEMVEQIHQELFTLPNEVNLIGLTQKLVTFHDRALIHAAGLCGFDGEGEVALVNVYDRTHSTPWSEVRNV